MKKITKLMFAGAAALPIIGLAGMSIVSAATGTTATERQDSFAQSLATKFNLNKDEVKTFLSEQRTAKQAEMKQKVADALKAAGFTDAQVTALQAKQDEQHTAMQTWRDANPNATRAEEKAHHEAEETAFETWAKEQGIDLTKVKDALKNAGVGHFGGHGHRGFGGVEEAGGDAPLAN